MKWYYPFIFCLYLSIHSLQAQCTVDAGPDLDICTDLYGVKDTVMIQPTITGQAPYTVTWSANHPFTSTINIYASHFLDDTTALTPSITTYPGVTSGTSITLYVQIVDVNNDTCIDSTRVRFSVFGALTISPVKQIYRGDTTTLLSYVSGGIGLSSGSVTHSWSPSYNISDTTSENVEVWPEVDTLYNYIYTDSIGCNIDAPWWVYVFDPPNSVNQSKTQQIQRAWIYAPAGTHQFTLQLEGKLTEQLYLEVYNTSGQRLLSDQVTQNTYIFNSANWPGGVYYIKLYDSNHQPIKTLNFSIP